MVPSLVTCFRSVTLKWSQPRSFTRRHRRDGKWPKANEAEKDRLRDGIELNKLLADHTSVVTHEHAEETSPSAEEEKEERAQQTGRGFGGRA